VWVVFFKKLVIALSSVWHGLKRILTQARRNLLSLCACKMHILQTASLNTQYRDSYVISEYKVVQIWPGLAAACLHTNQSQSYLNHLVYFLIMVILQWHELNEGKYSWHIRCWFSLYMENNESSVEVKICTWPISTPWGGGGGDDGDGSWDVIMELPKQSVQSSYILIEILAWLSQNGILW